MNMFYVGGTAQRMPSTWQSWLLRVGTFLAVAAGSWYSLLKNYSALGLSEYASMLQTVGNTKMMFAFSYLIYTALLYLLYTFFVRIAYNSLARQLFFFDVALGIYDFRLRVDPAVIALCVFKALISVVYMANPLYEGVIRSVLNPLAAACAFGAALYALVLRVGKQNKEAVICQLSILFCLPMVFA